MIETLPPVQPAQPDCPGVTGTFPRARERLFTAVQAISSTPFRNRLETFIFPGSRGRTEQSSEQGSRCQNVTPEGIADDNLGRGCSAVEHRL